MKAGLQEWTLIHTQPYAEILSQVQRLRYTTLLLTVLFLVLSVTVAVIISKRLYKPFEQMFSSIVSKAPNELISKEQTKDEIAFLSGLYGNMMDRVKLADSNIAENRWILKRFTLRRLVQESQTMSPAQWQEEADKSGLSVHSGGGYMICVARIDDSASLMQERI